MGARDINSASLLRARDARRLPTTGARGDEASDVEDDIHVIAGVWSKACDVRTRLG